MIVLVFLGTIFQGELGLYQTQKIYFSSWLYWLGFIPMLGGKSIILIMLINLFGFLFRKKLWKYKKIGIIITHCGGIILLIGSGITAYSSYEGQLSLPEGEKSNIIQDYYLKEFSIQINEKTSIQFNENDLYAGNIVDNTEIINEIIITNKTSKKSSREGKEDK